MTQNTSPQNALDHLVVAQLNAIIDNETNLRRRYSSLLQSSSEHEWELWTREMQQLQARTDRLARMLGAWDGTYTMPLSTEKTSYAA
jgi:hypothetical protein